MPATPEPTAADKVIADLAARTADKVRTVTAEVDALLEKRRSSKGSSGDKAALSRVINEKRATIGLPPLTWSKAKAAPEAPVDTTDVDLDTLRAAIDATEDVAIKAALQASLNARTA
jgi:hypothetical protein